MLEHGKGTAMDDDRKEEAARRAEEAERKAEEAASPPDEEAPAEYGGEADAARPTRGWGSDTPGD